MQRLLIFTHLVLLSLSGVSAAAQQSKTTQAGKTTSQVQITRPGNKKPQVSARVEHQTDSTEVTQVSVDKQKASVRLQVGEGGEADPFFTTPWRTPRAIPLPLTCVPMAESDLIPLVKEASLDQDLRTELIRAVIRRESASLWCAVSDKGAVGLMQLMPDVAQQFGVDPYDARQNVQAGSKYLKQLMTRYKGDTKLALAAYNAGPVVVDAAGGVPSIPETTAFVGAILKDIESNAATVSAGPKPE
jgi:Transglycosylase SLT domain